MQISPENFSEISGEIFLGNSQEFLGAKFLRNSKEFVETMFLIQFPKKSVKLVTKSWEFLRNFRRNVPETFLGISWEKFQRNSQDIFKTKSHFQFPKQSGKLVTKFWEFLRNFWRNIYEKFSGISWGKNTSLENLRNFLWKISWEILNNFLRQCLLFSSTNNT